MKPESLNQLFPLEQQRNYIAMLMGRGGLTRRRAECFVRLWAYLVLKHRHELGEQDPQPLTQLYPPEGMIACTHREASELFYSHQERGSDRAAGMMIDRLVALGLLEKRFDGQTLCLQVRSLPELSMPQATPTPVKLSPDAFNPRTDAIPIANLLTQIYAELIKDPTMVSHKIARSLREWSRKYPQGMRVLRRSDNLNPVAICILYPTASGSEFNFFQSPSKSFYLTTDTEIDPFEMASPGDPDCTSVYIRAWTIDMNYIQGPNLYQFLVDTQLALTQMQQDFPNLCDLYSIILHPLYEELRLALGFQKTCQDPQRSYHWIYLALDRFLQLDIKQVLAGMRLDSSSQPKAG